MELLCIQSHSKGAVIAGNTYTAISDEKPCGCTEAWDVGVEDPISGPGTLVMWADCCGKVMPNDGIWWISKELFAPIASDSDSEERQKALIEKI